MADKSVELKLTREGEKLKKALKELESLEVFVGFQRGKPHKEKKKKKTEKEPPDVLDIALWNELGTSRGIPARPFIRQTYDKNKATFDNSLKTAAQMVAGGQTAKQALSTLGNQAVGLMQAEIVDGGFAPNAPRTLEAKDSDVPLIDTGHMRQSVHFVVRKKGSGES
jgi:hypothetical protein